MGVANITGLFDEKRRLPSGETLEILRQNYFIEATMRGSDDTSIGGVNINPSGRADAAAASQERNKKAAADALFLDLLQDIRQRYEELGQRMAEMQQRLETKYGKDFIGGMAATFLDEKTLSGLKTDEEKMRALSKLFLDENGDIKDEYKHLEEAQYLRDWTEAQKLKPVVAKYEGRNSLEPVEQREVYETGKSLPNVDAENMRQLSSNDAVKVTVEKAIDSNRASYEGQTDSAAFSFIKPA